MCRNPVPVPLLRHSRCKGPGSILLACPALMPGSERRHAGKQPREEELSVLSKPGHCDGQRLRSSLLTHSTSSCSKRQARCCLAPPRSGFPPLHQQGLILRLPSRAFRTMPFAERIKKPRSAQTNPPICGNLALVGGLVSASHEKGSQHTRSSPSNLIYTKLI